MTVYEQPLVKPHLRFFDEPNQNALERHQRFNAHPLTRQESDYRCVVCYLNVLHLGKHERVRISGLEEEAVVCGGCLKTMKPQEQP